MTFLEYVVKYDQNYFLCLPMSENFCELCLWAWTVIPSDTVKHVWLIWRWRHWNSMENSCFSLIFHFLPTQPMKGTSISGVFCQLWTPKTSCTTLGELLWKLEGLGCPLGGTFPMGFGVRERYWMASLPRWSSGPIELTIPVPVFVWVYACMMCRGFSNNVLSLG